MSPRPISESEPTKAERREFVEAHAEGLHDGCPREFCPECDAQRAERRQEADQAADEVAEQIQRDDARMHREHGDDIRGFAQNPGWIREMRS